MTIRLYWSGGNRNEINFGDTLSPLVVRHVSGQDVSYAGINTCDLAAVGSLLDKVITREWKRLLRLRFDKIRIWGTGAFGSEALKEGRDKLSIAAVRGPMTREAMGLEASLPLGDPGLLIEQMTPPVEKKYRWGIIPHVVDIAQPAIQALHKENDCSCLIDLADPDVIAVAQKIRACDFIISTSLHGLITADAFGIPNVWMRVSGNIGGGDWKFLDYFASVERREKEPLSLAHGAPSLKSLEDTASRVGRDVIACRQGDLLSAFKTLGF